MHRPPEQGPSPGQQFALVWAVVSVQLALTSRLFYLTGRGDPDDAMRLFEVRNYIAGRAWFDLHEPRVSPPLGYDTHWSRLVDGALANLQSLFALFSAPDQAEFLMRMAWPLVCFALALAAMMAIARHLAGDGGLMASGFIAILGIPAYVRFLPGRIDHHCVQILLAVTVLWLAITAEAKPWRGAAAGLATALALAVGLEAVPFLMISAGALVVAYVRDATQARTLALYGFGLATGLACFHFGAVAPALWMNTACDALGINLVLPLMLVGLGLAGAVRLTIARGKGMRLAVLLALAIATAALALLLQPRCLLGPFEMVSPEVRRAWLDRVGESQPLIPIGAPRNDLETVLPLLVAIITATSLLLLRRIRHSAAFLTVFTAFAIACMISIGNAKIAAYALWFAMPLLGVATTLVWSRLGIEPLWQRATVAVLFAPFTYAAIAFAVKLMLTPASQAEAEVEAKRTHACGTADYAALSALPTGLVLTDVDAGPFVLLATRHSVVAAPYHRLAQNILDSLRIFKMPAADAERAVRETGADYVVVCRQPDTPMAPTTLEAALLASQPPPWLKPIPVPGERIFAYSLR